MHLPVDLGDVIDGSGRVAVHRPLHLGANRETATEEVKCTREIA